MLAAHDSTTILAKSLLSYRKAFDVYVDRRSMEDESELTLALGAVAGAIGAATSVTTVSAPLSLGAIGSFVTGCGWPTVLTVSSPWGLLIGGVLATGALIRKSQLAGEENLINPEKLRKHATQS
jgi:hypothetical protein